MSHSLTAVAGRAFIDSTFPTTIRNFSIRLPSRANVGRVWYVLKAPSRNEPWNVVYRGTEATMRCHDCPASTATELYTLHLTAAPAVGSMIQVAFASVDPNAMSQDLTAGVENYVFRIFFRAP